MNKEKYYITTAIAYTSTKPHIGNTYEIILTDAIARYKRLLGYDVFFMTGTDEHGEKIEQKAKEAGMEPRVYVDKIAGEVKTIWDLMNTSYDKFIRTTDEYHEKAVQKIFKKLYDQGDIYLGEYEGMYCTPCESFWTDSQLVDGKCPDCGREVKKSKEEAYFFKLSKYQDRLVKHIEDNKEFIQPESRKNEMINNFLKPGLLDLCVSRTSFKWGVPVDFNPGHVVYVWIDALSNYITGLGYGSEDDSLFRKYWPADVHLIGKDILRFHTLYWPIMLMALDIPVPKQIFGHPWLLSGIDKMSKSKGNVLYADQLVEKYGVDAIRYFVLREMPFAQDGSITDELIVGRINGDLANVLGNLVNRTVTMVNKYNDGVVENKNVAEEIDADFKKVVEESVRNVTEKMDKLRVQDALEEIWNMLRRSNKYIDETTPWILCKEETKRDRLNTVLYNLIESIRFGAILLKAFMPETCDQILEQIGCSKEEATIESIRKFGFIKNETRVTKTPEPLFARIDVNEKKEGAKEEKKQDYIHIDDFAKVKLKIAKVIQCEKVEGSEKLLRLQVELGEEKRQILSGISKYYTPDEIVGKQVVVVWNLEPRKLKGELSEGMILAAEDPDGNLRLLTVDGDISSGSEVS